MPGSFSDMPAQAFFLEVKKDFHYLPDKYGLSAISEETTGRLDICWIVFQGQHCSVKIDRDFGYVNVSIASTSLPDEWFALGDVITFLDRGTAEGEKIWFGPRPKLSEDYASEVRRQLIWYADKMRLYCDQISDLFGVEPFGNRHGELQEWNNLREEKRRREISKGNFPK